MLSVDMLNITICFCIKSKLVLHRLVLLSEGSVKSVISDLWFDTHLVDSSSFGQGANSSHVRSTSPAAVKTIPSDNKIKSLCLMKKKKKNQARAPRTK